MFRKSAFILVTLLFSLILSACSLNPPAEPGDSTNPPQQENSPTSQSLIVGLWEYIDENGEQKTYEFLNQTEFAEDFYYHGTYEFLSEQTISIYQGENTRILRLMDVSEKVLVLEEAGKQTTLKRIPPIPNLRVEIVGLWEWSDGTITEFAKDGSFLSNIWFYRNEHYKVLSNNTIVVYEGDNSEDVSQLLTFQKGDNNTIIAVSPKGLIAYNMGYENTAGDTPSTLVKSKGHSNLSNDILGIWKDEDGEVALEFVDSGKMIAHQANEIYDYKVISANTILFLDSKSKPEFMNVLMISKDNLQFRIWNPDPNIFLPVHNFTKDK